jgi:N6-L-threonylcarbamoyladenine synthase
MNVLSEIHLLSNKNTDQDFASLMINDSEVDKKPNGKSIVLAIESSCDETAVAVVQGGSKVLSSEIASQTEMHKIYGGVVPEIASRKHIEVVEGLTSVALQNAGISRNDIDAVAVTFAPGLIGALLVGLNYAKGIALSLNVPLIPVHHIRAHIASNYLVHEGLKPPFIGLVASGGHTLLLAVNDYTEYRVIGSTRDDAAGEAFDKAARALGFGYPGGSVLDKLSSDGSFDAYPLPRAKVDGNPYDMSFSGLKTAIINLIHNSKQKGIEIDIPGLAASICMAVSDTIVPRAVAACKEYNYSKLCVAGGVSANSVLRSELYRQTTEANIELFVPPISLCGDNAAMIGSQAYFEWMSGNIADMGLNAFATLPADYDHQFISK